MKAHLEYFAGHDARNSENREQHQTRYERSEGRGFFDIGDNMREQQECTENNCQKSEEQCTGRGEQLAEVVAIINSEFYDRLQRKVICEREDHPEDKLEQRQFSALGLREYAKDEDRNNGPVDRCQELRCKAPGTFSEMLGKFQN